MLINDVWKRYRSLILCSCLVLVVVFVALLQIKAIDTQYRQALVLQQEQLEQAQELAKVLHISRMNAKELQAAYNEIKTKTPVASFAVNALSMEVAADQLAKRIDKQDTALPPAALEKTDRTAVVKNDNEYKVDVLKINLDKAWELSAGVGCHRGDAYIPLGMQRNYAPHKAVAAEVHLVWDDLARGKIKTSGWEVRHVWRY